ncbi:hypothetical protein M404DRAFT_24987 [Pisolithus tinctorius Marx 270]|uniref:Uncharacterized protein n=1 Tax=Pisolithus tinctorius Marx 270 TaxID=870435 RepID=A0A0C3PDM6_PISTI|nr:hypothetical protein M404DRAFT_24987 [Pisolithus tinctorius Marx 270]
MQTKTKGLMRRKTVGREQSSFAQERVVIFGARVRHSGFRHISAIAKDIGSVRMLA